jgi:hypothetical protein
MCSKGARKVFMGDLMSKDHPVLALPLTVTSVLTMSIIRALKIVIPIPKVFNHAAVVAKMDITALGLKLPALFARRVRALIPSTQDAYFARLGQHHLGGSQFAMLVKAVSILRLVKQPAFPRPLASIGMDLRTPNALPVVSRLLVHRILPPVWLAATAPSRRLALPTAQQ